MKKKLDPKSKPIRIAIIGAQWGDEGKAKYVNEAVAEAIKNGRTTWVGRFQGGPNAGHTMFIPQNEGKPPIIFITHAAPSGIVSNTNIFIGPHTAFDPEKFVKEINNANNLGIFNNFDGIKISERTGVLLDYHRRIDGLKESRLTKKIGTTGSGIGPFYMDNANRTTRITFADYVSHEFPEILYQILIQKLQEYPELLAPDENILQYFDNLMGIHTPIREKLADCACRLEYVLNRTLTNGDNIIIEGAQGTMLDVDLGSVPDVTSSHLTAPSGLASLGLPRSAFKIILVEKLYPTRVGEGFMPTLANNDFGQLVQENSGECGATTGRKRRVGYPDWPLIKRSAILNDADGIVITRVDCVQDHKLKVCTGYKYPDGYTYTEVPLRLDKIFPVYADKTYIWKLWEGVRNLSDPISVDEKLSDTRQRYVNGGFDMLPSDLQEYIKDHDDFIGVPIVGVSIGPKQGETVKVIVNPRLQIEN